MSQIDAETLNKALAGLEADGQKFVEIVALREFLRSAPTLDNSASEIRKLTHDSNLAQYNANRNIEIEHFRSVVEAAKGALTTTLLVNGGAAIGLLALLGSLYSRPAGSVPLVGIQELVFSLAAFGLGTLTSCLATGSTYLTQFCYAQDYMKTGAGFHLLSVLLLLGSYSFFGYGVYRAFLGFS